MWKPPSANRLLTDLESIDRGIVLGNKELVASLNLTQRLLWVDAMETILLQFSRDILHCQESLLEKRQGRIIIF